MIMELLYTLLQGILQKWKRRLFHVPNFAKRLGYLKMRYSRIFLS